MSDTNSAGTPALAAIRPTEGRRLILPAGCTTPDGMQLLPGADMPAEGAIVPDVVWRMRLILRGDAEEVPAPPAPATPAAKSKTPPAGDPA